MQIEALWRYPVKSMQGEPCTELQLGDGGAYGDRQYGVLETRSGTILSAKREGRLLQASARLSEEGVALVTVPGAAEIPPGPELDQRLGEWLGRGVRLVESADHGSGTFECPQDFEDDGSPLVQWEGLSTSFVDESELLLLGTGDLAKVSTERPDLQWDIRRFRPNLVVTADAGSLDAVTSGRRVHVGQAMIELQYGCTRCVMTTRQQPGGLDRQLDIFRHLLGAHENVLGTRARIVHGGLVRVGDSLLVSE